MTSIQCRICGDQSDHRVFHVKETLLGMGDQFEYIQCGQCGCVQIAEIPENLSDFYPYSKFRFNYPKHVFKSFFRRLLDRPRILSTVFGKGKLTAWIDRFVKPLDYLLWLKITKTGFQDRILDVGCAHGKLLLRLRMAGYRHCTGLDPFYESTFEYPNGAKIYNLGLDEFCKKTSERFDLVMMHHSFEHMPDPANALATLKKLLSSEGRLLIRIPLSDSYAFRHFQENWVQWDPPRHLYLHTRKSMDILAQNTGFSIENVVYDSTLFQFIGSEAVKTGKPVHAVKGLEHEFPDSQIKEWRNKVDTLNKSEDGDQAIFILRAEV